MSLGSCIEEPQVTPRGVGPFRCLVNGHLYLPDAPWGYGSGAYADIQTHPDTISVVIYVNNSTTHQNLMMSFYDSPAPEVGKTYDLSDPRFYVQYIGNSCAYNKVSDGFVTLSKFQIANNTTFIVSGTFEFTASSDECTDTVVFADGRFNITERF